VKSQRENSANALNLVTYNFQQELVKERDVVLFIHLPKIIILIWQCIRCRITKFGTRRTRHIFCFHNVNYRERRLTQRCWFKVRFSPDLRIFSTMETVCGLLFPEMSPNLLVLRIRYSVVPKYKALSLQHLLTLSRL
jgi:hypothetical protein